MGNVKNTTSRKASHAVAATILTGVLLAITGCGATSNGTPAESQSPATESAIAQASPSATAAETPAETDPLKGTHGLTIKGLAENEHGQYLQITIAPDDPALVYQPELVNPAISAAFTPEEIKEAQKFTMTFAIEEVIDSVLNGGYEKGDEWFAENKDRIDASIQPTVMEYIKANKEFIHRKSWGSDYSGKLNYVYDKDSTRIVGYGLRLTEVTQDPNALESIVFRADYAYNIVTEHLPNAKKFSLHVDGKLTLAAKKDPANPGKWLITGIHTNFTGIPDPEDIQ